MVQAEQRQNQARLAQKERRQNDSIKEVLEYCKEQMTEQAEALTGNIENIQT